MNKPHYQVQSGKLDVDLINIDRSTAEIDDEKSSIAIQLLDLSACRIWDKRMERLFLTKLTFNVIT